MKWSTATYPIHRARVQHILHDRPGPIRQAQAIVTSILESFTPYVSDEIISLVVQYTTMFGERMYNVVVGEGLREGGWMRTNIEEMKAFIGLLILCGPLRAQHEPVESLWSQDSSITRPLLPATMIRRRFFQLMISIRCDDLETREERQLTEKLAAIREVLDKFMVPCRLLYNPSPEITIDEQLIRFFGHCRFRIYMPSKPDKYGIKVWVCADSENGYANNFQVIFC